MHENDSATCSTDDDLRQVVSTFSHQIPTINELKTIDDVLCAAMMKTTVLVGRELLTNNAILLPSVHDSFCEYAKELLRATHLQGEEVEVNKLVSSRWILSNLTANLKHHINYTCQVRKVWHITLQVKLRSSLSSNTSFRKASKLINTFKCTTRSCIYRTGHYM